MRRNKGRVLKIPSNIFLIIPSIFWGIQPIDIKLLQRQFSTNTIILLRSICMMIVYVALMRRSCVKIIPAISLKKWFLLIGMGITGTTICCVSQFEGLRFAPVFHCLISSAAALALTSFLAYILIREKLTFIQWIGILFSVAGVLLMLTQGNWQILLAQGLGIGDILYFTNEISWSLYIIMGRILMRVLSPIQVTVWSSMIGVATYVPYVMFQGDIAFDGVTYETIFLFLFLIFFSGAMGNIFWNKGISLIGTKGAVYNNITPFVGIFFSWLILGEKIKLFDIIGFFMVLLGIYILMKYKA